MGFLHGRFRQAAAATVDAWNVTVQHELTKTISLEAAYVATRAPYVFAGGGPAFNVNQATLDGFTREEIRTLLSPFPEVWMDARHRLLLQLRRQPLQRAQTKITKRFGSGYSLLAHYTYQRAIFNDADQFIFDRELNRGPQDFDRTHNFVLSQVAELPIGAAGDSSGTSQGR
jgi:hypothetical protein